MEQLSEEKKTSDPREAVYKRMCDLENQIRDLKNTNLQLRREISRLRNTCLPAAGQFA